MSAAETLTPGASDAPSQEAIRWVALGDSFTAGLSPSERTWAMIVRDRLGDGRTASLLNLARVGARTTEVEREQLPVAAGSDPTLVTLICGGNDVVRSVRPDLDSLTDDLDRLFAKAGDRLPTARLVTATYPAIACDSLRQRTRRRITDGMTAVNSIIREVSASRGIECVELAEHPGQADTGNYADDGIHPSPAGHRAAADVLGSAIEDLLRAEPEEDR